MPQSRFLCRGMIPLSIYSKKSKLMIITQGDLFGSYLRLGWATFTAIHVVTSLNIILTARARAGSRAHERSIAFRTLTFVTCPMAALAGNMDSASSTYPTWADGLKKSGLYNDGFVDDIESVLEQHRKDTVTF